MDQWGKRKAQNSSISEQHMGETGIINDNVENNIVFH